MTKKKSKRKLSKTWKKRLLRHIQEFHLITGMKHTTIGKNSIRDPRMWERLNRPGGDIGVDKADEIYDYFAAAGHRFKR